MKPIYNSQIIQGLIEYIRASEPGVDISKLLNAADLKRQNVENPAHWFTQIEIDRFHLATLKMINNPTLPRDAGRYLSASKAMQGWTPALIRLSSPASAYALMGRIYPTISRGASISVRKISATSVEIISTPTPEADEKGFQCEHRIGSFESLAQLFTNEMATVEHPECLFRGADHCRYLVSWTPPPSMRIRKFRNVATLLWLLSLSVGFAVLNSTGMLIALTVSTIAMAALALHTSNVEKRELSALLRRATGGTGEGLIEEINRRQSHALLVQSVGHITVSAQSTKAFLATVLDSIHAHLDFDRSAVFLLDAETGKLSVHASHGVDANVLDILPPQAQAAFAETMAPSAIAKELSNAGRDDFRVHLGLGAIATAPVAHGNQVLGLLVVGYEERTQKISPIDVDVLRSIGAQTAMAMLFDRTFNQLGASEQKYRELVESATAVIVLADAQGIITFCNQSGCKHFGLNEPEVIGAPLTPMIYGASHTDDKALTPLLDAASSPIKEVVYETVCNSVGNERIWTAWTLKASTDAHGQVIGVLAIGTDVTALREEEDRQKQLECLAVEAQKLDSISTLTGGIAHGFNNVLQRVYGYTGLLLMQKELTDTSKEFAQQIIAGTKDASRLTELLLGFGRGGRYEVEALDPSIVAAETVLMLTPTTQGVHLRESYAKNQGLIDADPGQIEQALANVCTNAIEAMPNGGELLVETSYHTLEADALEPGIEPGFFVRIRVSDTGGGIDDAVRERIFEPFFSTRPMGPTTQGLGLAAAHGIVKNHGGQIVVESTPGQGATFDIYLPASPLVPRTSGAHGTVPLEGHETILVVDDEEFVTVTLAQVLQRYGYKVLTATSGAQAIALVDRDNPHIDLIILDVVMPGMNGMQTYRELQVINSTAPVILSSGYPMTEGASTLIDDGCVGFLKKPYSAEVLVKHIRSALPT